MLKKSSEKNKLKTTITVEIDGRICVQDGKQKDPNDLIIGYPMLLAIVQHEQKTGYTFEIREEKNSNDNIFSDTHIFKRGNNITMTIKSSQTKDSFNNDGRDISFHIQTKEPDEILEFLKKNFDIASVILDKRKSVRQI